MILEVHPHFEDQCPWEEFDGYCWSTLLRAQPQFADKCSWDELDGAYWWRTELGLEDCDATRSKYNTVKYNKDLGERMMEWACSVWNLPYANGGIAKFMRDMYINDIHCGNWGWIGDRLVLVDYSGYGEYYSDRDIDY